MIFVKAPLGTLFIDNVYYYSEIVFPPRTINFEVFNGVGSNWDWTVSENDDNPPLEIINNPVGGGINTGGKVAKFTARQNGAPYALTFTDENGEFTFNSFNSTVKIMVYKPVISNVAIKFEGMGSSIEIQIPNTVTNQWEQLTFDFSGVIGNTFHRLIIIPDFAARTQDNIIYFDNIIVPEGYVAPPPPEPTTAAPTPTLASINVISLFSDAYSDVPVDTWLTPWSDAGYEEVLIEGNATKKYTSVNFFGVETVGDNLLDVSGMTHLHLDMWTPDANNFNVKLVDFGPDGVFGGGDDSEHELVFATPETETWISYDIPLTDFTNLNITGNMAQYIFVKSPLGTVYLDNIYFYTGSSALDITVILEGPYNGLNMFAKLNPSLLPLAQPYNDAPWDYDGTENVVSLPNTNVVDWVLVDMHDAPSAGLVSSETMVERRAAFLLRNGKIVDLDGSSKLPLDFNLYDSLFVKIWHRNHLQVLSAHGLQRVNNNFTYNFTTGSGKAFGGNLKNLGGNTWGMFAGNANGDNQINELDKTGFWDMEVGENGYLRSDFNLNGQTDNKDKNDYWNENTGAVSEQYELIWQDEFNMDGAPAPDK